jgi:hypothetical protein
MKQTILFNALILIFIASCSNAIKDNEANFIPGIYVKEIKQEFAVGMDTLIIQVMDKEAGSYTIVRRSSYQQQLDGKLMTPKYEIEKSVAIYEPATKQLREQNKERVFTFSEEKGLLSTGGSEYKKVE